MAETLLILYQPEQSDWCLLNEKKQLVSRISRASLSDLATQAKGRKVIVVLSGMECSFFYVALPPKNTRKALAALPLLLEEQLSDDIDELLFVTQKKISNHHIGVVVINKAVIEQIRAQLQQAGLVCDAIYPAFALLPEATACFYQDQVYCHLDRQHRFSCRQSLLPLLLESIDMTDKPLQCHIAEGSEVSAGFPCADSSHQHPLEVFAAQQAHGDFNLLEKKQRHINLGAQVKLWGLPVLLLLLLVGMFLFERVSETRSLQQQAQQMRALSEQILKKTFPEIKKVRNPRMLMKSKLKQISSNQSRTKAALLQRLFDVGSTLKDFADIRVLAIDGSATALEVELQVKQLQQMDTIKNILQDRDGYQVRVASISQNKSTATGRLIIK